VEKARRNSGSRHFPKLVLGETKDKGKKNGEKQIGVRRPKGEGKKKVPLSSPHLISIQSKIRKRLQEHVFCDWAATRGRELVKIDPPAEKENGVRNRREGKLRKGH